MQVDKKSFGLLLTEFKPLFERYGTDGIKLRKKKIKTRTRMGGSKITSDGCLALTLMWLCSSCEMKYLCVIFGLLEPRALLVMLVLIFGVACSTLLVMLMINVASAMGKPYSPCPSKDILALRSTKSMNTKVSDLFLLFAGGPAELEKHELAFEHKISSGSRSVAR
jgi:hypothetical protein